MIEVFENEDAKHYLDEDDFSLSWENILNSTETITNFSVAVISGGLTVEDISFVGPITTARVSGGTVGMSRVRYTITTSTGRLLNADVYIKIVRGNL